MAVETYINGMKHTLSQLTAQAIEPLDFSDDRLSHLLKHVSKKPYWKLIGRRGSSMLYFRNLLQGGLTDRALFEDRTCAMVLGRKRTVHV